MRGLRRSDYELHGKKLLESHDYNLLECRIIIFAILCQECIINLPSMHIFYTGKKITR